MSGALLFLKLESPSGVILGDSRVKEYKDQIELSDWKWSINRKAENGDVEPGIFQFSKLMDRSTTPMLGAMRNGESLKALINLEDASNEDFHLVITLEQVRITSFKLDAEADDAGGAVEEDWDFNYESIKFEYRATDKEGYSTVLLKRPAGASTDSPRKTEDKILALAEDLEPGRLNELWAKLRDMAEKGKYDQKPAAKKTTETTGVKGG